MGLSSHVVLKKSAPFPARATPVTDSHTPWRLGRPGRAPESRSWVTGSVLGVRMAPTWSLWSLELERGEGGRGWMGDGSTKGAREAGSD